jgi:tryptophan 2,3-dioxygenase
MPISYGSYLKIPELLTLQQPLSRGPEHDETLFIIIHQVYELWFKQQLHEAAYLRTRLEANDQSMITATLKRMLTILKTMVAQIDVLETMTPTNFTSFRSQLENSSGFQSWQFREFEFVLGHRRARAIEWQPVGSPERAALEQRLREPSLWESFLRYLVANKFAVPKDAIERDRTLPTEANEKVQDLLVEAYRSNPSVRGVCELLVDLDEGIQEWRYRHVKMVERTIGARAGTGGSSGAAYLRETVGRQIFPDLWAIRSQL